MVPHATIESNLFEPKIKVVEFARIPSLQLAKSCAKLNPLRVPISQHSANQRRASRLCNKTLAAKPFSRRTFRENPEIDDLSNYDGVLK